MNIKFNLKRILLYSIFIVTVIQIASCKKVETAPLTLVANKPPIANAGADQTIVLQKDSVLLDGTTSSDADGTIATYTWVKISGPSSFQIINSGSSKTVVKSLTMGVYKFELTVTDNGGLSAKDTLQVMVNDSTSTSQLSFWTDEGSKCLCTGDPINITVNNTTKILDKYYYGRPVTTCEDNNAIRFNLMSGTYLWLAVRGKDTLKGSVNLNANSCVLQEIFF